MNPSIDIACGFLDGTIISVEGGYRILQHPRSERVFNRLSDARWFLAVRWCNQCETPAGILTHDGQLSFHNQASLTLGETVFLPLEHRQAIFDRCLSLSPNTKTLYVISENHHLEVFPLEIDPRYGKITIVRQIS